MPVAVADQPAPEATVVGTDRQPLNPPDRLMQVAHQAGRDLGAPGFICQCHAWLENAVDTQRLRAALHRLAEHHPVVTSRLARDDASGGVAWMFRPGERLALHETALDSSDESAVSQNAESLFLKPCDLAAVDPISFHLLHLPDGRDVFIVRWCHALMDGKAPELVLKEIDRLSTQAAQGDLLVKESHMSDESNASTATHPATPDDPDDILAYLHRSSRWRRARCALRVMGSHIRWPVRSVTLTPPDATDWLASPTRIALRTFTDEQTAALTERVKRLCGFANLSPAVLASVFRVTSRMSPHRQDRRTGFQTDVPLNLRPPGAAGPIFRNFMSFVSMRASYSDLGNRDQLTRMLNTQMRDQIRRGIDLGNLQMMATLVRWVAAMRKHLIERARHHPMTLGYGFLGPVVPGLTSLCGTPIERLYTLNAAMSPPGVTLQVNLCRGRLNLALTYIPVTVPEETANTYLSEIERDLLA